MKKLIQKILHRQGYRIVRRFDGAVIDGRPLGNDPFLTHYHSAPVVVDLPAADGIGLHNFTLEPGGLNPFVRATEAALAVPAGERPSAIAAALRDYYERVRPAHAADWLGLEGGTMGDLPPWSAVMPWQVRSPAIWREIRERGVPKENREAGRALGFEHGWHACGPVSDEKIQVESVRLARLIASIEETGLQRHDGPEGDIEGFVLDDGIVRRWWIVHGHHRAAALSAMGHTSLPVRVWAVIEARHVDIWPNVVSGAFKRPEALAVFKRLIAGQAPPVAADWKTFVEASASP